MEIKKQVVKAAPPPQPSTGSHWGEVGVFGGLTQNGRQGPEISPAGGHLGHQHLLEGFSLRLEDP